MLQIQQSFWSILSVVDPKPIQSIETLLAVKETTQEA
jgi:hypothetical protein